MFNFLKKGKTLLSTAGHSENGSQKFYSVVFFPDGETLSSDWVQYPAEHLPAAGAEGKFREIFQLDDASFILDGTMRGGQGIFSIWHGERIVTSSALVSGTEPKGDRKILELFLQGMLRTDLVQQLTAQVKEPFSEVHACHERPYCVTLLMPLEPFTGSLLEWQMRWVAAHLQTVSK